ncbi:hydroxyisourate hydrolase [Luedemannella helvata]|uniref:5-hydroxyisourate hydrolase n=1 Tax=Luedemannella helvata TaxID=349315 RepID=A0ABN2JXK2_9ACTN
MSISTHVLDTTRGVPAPGVGVRLERLAGTGWEPAGTGVTDADGRLRLAGDAPSPGRHRLIFDAAAHLGPDAFFPEIVIVFEVTDPAARLHVPLLLSPYGYTTYRGS